MVPAQWDERRQVAVDEPNENGLVVVADVSQRTLVSLWRQVWRAEAKKLLLEWVWKLRWRTGRLGNPRW